MRGLIVDFVRSREYVTFPELTRRLAGDGIAVRGDHSIIMGSDPNIILWANLSAEVSSAVQALLGEQRLHIHASGTLVHFIDGGLLDLPLARRPPRGGYKQPHWAPVTLCTFPAEQQK